MSAPAPTSNVAPNAAPIAPVAQDPSTDLKAPAAPEPAKDADPIETELAEKYGEQWTALPENMRAQVLAAEKKGRDADKKYQMVAKLQKDHDLTQKQAAQLLDALVNDPDAVFTNPAIMKRLNHAKLQDFAERVVWEKIQQERMDPKDRELARLKKFEDETLAEKKSRLDAEEQERTDAEMKEAVLKRREYWEREIIGALKAQGVEADGVFIAQVARYIQASRRAGKDVDLPRIITQVQSDFNNWQMRYLMSGFKPRQEGESNEAFAQRYDQWTSRLNPQLVDVIRSGDLAKLKNKNMGRPVGSSKSEPKRESSKKMSMSEWMDKRDERLGRK